VPTADCRKCGIVFAKIRTTGLTESSVDEPEGFKIWRAPPEPKKKRPLLKILVVLALGGTASLALLVFLGLQWTRESETYGDAAALATTHPIVTQAVGEPVQIARFFPFQIETHFHGDQPDTGSSSFTLSVSGPRGNGVVVVESTLFDETWTVEDAVFLAEDGGRRMLVEQRMLLGLPGSQAAAVPEAPRGLTVEQLMKSDVETWGTPVAVHPRSTPSARADADSDAAAAVRSPARAAAERADCPYTGSTSRYVNTIKPSGMRREVRRSSGCVTLVTIWGAWCPSCREHYPYVANLADTYRDSGLAFHSFATDQDTGVLEEFLGAQIHRRGTIRLQLDPGKKGLIQRAASDFGASYGNAVPFYALFDRDNNVVVQGTSRVYERLEPTIRALLAG
jgi:thiol-disulfide isomerase/thioredoxin